MTAPTPIPGNDPGLPANGIMACLDQALTLKGIIDALDLLDNEMKCPGGKTALIRVAKERVERLADDLDQLA